VPGVGMSTVEKLCIINDNHEQAIDSLKTIKK